MSREEILKIHSTRNHKITNSVGVYDIYKSIRKTKWLDLKSPISEHEFYEIIRGVNLIIAEKIANGIDIKLPARMGYIELRKYNSAPVLRNGKLKVKYPVDWKETIKLWSTDGTARKDKVLVRSLVKYVYYVYYNKNKANYNNKSFYKLSINRNIKTKLKENILKGKVDAFITK